MEIWVVTGLWRHIVTMRNAHPMRLRDAALEPAVETLICVEVALAEERDPVAALLSQVDTEALVDIQ